MHDEMLERRLRDALHSEGDALGLTITAPELERRMAARRRARSTRSFGLLVAATLSIGALGAAAVAGGFFDQHRPSPAPSQLAELPATSPSAETPTPTSLVLPLSLPPMSEFLAPLDQARLVRAQALGPLTAPASWTRDIAGPGTTVFAPVTAAGSYRVYLACLGADVTLGTGPEADSQPANSIPITCDGQTTVRDVGLEAGDSVAIDAPAPASWRFALLAPERDAPHAGAIASIDDVRTAAGKRLDNDASSADAAPDDGSAPSTSPEPQLATVWSSSDSYRIAVACDGPGPLTYALRWPTLFTEQVNPSAALATMETSVECDGRPHVDIARYPFVNGADVWITAPAGTAWRIAAAHEGPPFQEPEDGGGWKLGVGLGPNWITDQDTDHAGFTMRAANRIRIVVTCRGGAGVDITLKNLATSEVTMGTAECRTGETAQTFIPVAGPGRQFSIDTTAHGAMWLAVTIQQADPPQPNG